MFKKLGFLFSSISLLVMSLVGMAVFALPAFALADTNSIITQTADRLVTLQNANGSWDWIVTDANAPTTNTYYNITGVTGQELLDAYAIGHSAVYLTAAEAAGNYIIATPISESQRQNGYNIVFLNNLATASSNATYSAEATAILNSIFTQGNYWSVNSGNNCDNTTGCRPDELLAGDESYRNAPSTSPDGIVPWDLETYVQAEVTAGNSANALALATDINAYVTNVAYTSSVPDYALGLASAIRADILTGISYTSLLTALDVAQAGDGSFGKVSDGQVQATAYALDALLVANDSHAIAAASYLSTHFTYTDSSVTYNGWKETDNNEYSEVDSEAAHALFATLPAVTTNTATALAPTGATVNGTNGPTSANNTSFWWGTTSAGPFTSAVDPSSELPPGWSHDSGLGSAPASGAFSNPLTGLTSGTTYYFVAWSLIGGTWYPGAVLSFTTPAGPTPSVVTNSATGETVTTATLNGTNGPVDADNTSFWWGTTPIGSLTAMADPSSEFPTTNWSHDSGLGAVLAGGTISGPVSGLTAGTNYYYVAWSHVGGVWYPGAVLSFTTPVQTASCPVGTTQASSPLETVPVNSNLSTPTVSSNSLTSGQSYLLVPSGTWQNSGLNVADSAYASLDSWTTYMEGYDITPYLLGQNEFKLQVNNSFVNWGSYNSGHSYSYQYTGTGAPVSLGVFDGDSNTNTPNPGWYGDNSGSLSVAIYPCNPTTGTLTIEKDSIGGNGTFNFTSNIPGGSSFSITTASGVGYSQTFTGLTPGTYNVTEVAKSGWTQTDSECSAVVVTAGGVDTCIITNTNNKLLGEIRGTKYSDRDGDGKLSDGDHHRLAGVTINLTGPVTASTVTDSHGNYHFSSLPAGTYHVNEISPSGWVETYPVSGSYTIVLAAGKISKKDDFGNFKLGSISGMKYNDLNGDGRKDNGEVGIASVTINITGPNGFTATTHTDANGNYSFTGLKAGTYTLSEVIPTATPAWRQTDHPSKVRIQSGTVSTNDNFGNTQKVIVGRGDHDNDFSYGNKNNH
jgi:hypothetical protein